MSALHSCGICCMLVSVWGVLQLFFMGIFFYVEAISLLEDVEAHEYDDYNDFIQKTKDNYSKTAINCWIAAAIYLLTLGLSYTCIVKANRKAAREAMLLLDDEFACTPKVVKEKKKKKKKVDDAVA